MIQRGARAPKEEDRRPQRDETVSWWKLTAEEVAESLEADLERGLAASEAELRYQTAGPNELIREPGTPPWRMFLRQFANTMIVVLLVAAAITAVVGEVRDTIVIGAIVVLNAVVGFVQEYRAEQALEALKEMAAPFARVLRDGEDLHVPAAELVPGDLVKLEAGDIVPADGRLIDAPNLRVNEAALTGESVPIDKDTATLDGDDELTLPERKNMVFKGTPVTYGRARTVVVATGMHTELGRVAGMLHRHKAPSTPLQVRLDALGRRLAVAAVVVAGIVFLGGIIRGEELALMFLTAVSLAVAAIPEALPAVVTIALALGAKRLVARHALVRKLPAVETLGSVTVICTDKTGTLTQAVMQVERVWTSSGEYTVAGNGYDPEGRLTRVDGAVDAAADSSTKLDDLFAVAALCNDATLVPPESHGDGWDVSGDPTEGALLALAERGGLKVTDLRQAHPRVREVPFDSDRKLMTTVHRDPTGDTLIASKGAPEVILSVISAKGGSFGETSADVVHQQAEDYAAAGYRVLALAGRRAADGEVDVSDPEADLELLGLVAMADPPRPEALAAVAECKSAGMVPVMITGDHPATAKAIAERLGILDGHAVMTGAELARHPDDLAQKVEDVRAYARVSPEQKLDIVRAWNARGQVVAMTGDGVNDAPALRRADIGVAMGISGTEVSKEAADMVLTDDNFATIVAAVEEGRRIYDNIRRFIRYTLTSNSGEIWVMFLAPFLGLPLPLLPVHILWINLVTDGLPGLALGVEPAERDVMKRPPRSPSESIFSRGLWQHVLAIGLLMGAVPLALGAWGYANDRPWRTMIFTSLALLQLGHALAVRSEKESLLSLGLRSNIPLLLAVAGTLLLQLVVVYWEPFQILLHTEALSLGDLVMILLASTLVLWAVEGEKWWRRSSMKEKRGER